jgi:hypothetical protein
MRRESQKGVLRVMLAQHSHMPHLDALAQHSHMPHLSFFRRSPISYTPSWPKRLPTSLAVHVVTTIGSRKCTLAVPASTRYAEVSKETY